MQPSASQVRVHLQVPGAARCRPGLVRTWRSPVQPCKCRPDAHLEVLGAAKVKPGAHLQVPGAANQVQAGCAPPGLLAVADPAAVCDLCCRAVTHYLAGGQATQAYSACRAACRRRVPVRRNQRRRRRCIIDRREPMRLAARCPGRPSARHAALEARRVDELTLRTTTLCQRSCLGPMSGSQRRRSGRRQRSGHTRWQAAAVEKLASERLYADCKALQIAPGKHRT